MPLTPDERAGPLIEEEIQMEDRTGDEPAPIPGQMIYADGRFKATDSQGTYDPRSGGVSIGDLACLFVITLQFGFVVTDLQNGCLIYSEESQ